MTSIERSIQWETAECISGAASINRGFVFDWELVTSNGRSIQQGTAEVTSGLAPINRGFSFDREVQSGAGDEQWTIYATGHSMGGALATLFAYELAQHDFKRVR